MLTNSQALAVEATCIAVCIEEYEKLIDAAFEERKQVGRYTPEGKECLERARMLLKAQDKLRAKLDRMKATYR